MNEAFATTGLRTLTINSVEQFEIAPFMNGQPWNLTGGTVTLRLADMNGNTYALSGVIGPTGYTASVVWTVIGPAGVWVRAWDITDASGIRQVMLPTAFDVVSSPT